MFQWITRYYIFFDFFAFWEDQQSVLFIKFLYHHRLYVFAVCSYTKPMMMSAFMNAGDNACPLVNYIVKIMAFGLLSPVRIRDMLMVKEVDIFSSNFCQKTSSDK